MQQDRFLSCDLPAVARNQVSMPLMAAYCQLMPACCCWAVYPWSSERQLLAQQPKRLKRL